MRRLMKERFEKILVGNLLRTHNMSANNQSTSMRILTAAYNLE